MSSSIHTGESILQPFVELPPVSLQEPSTLLNWAVLLWRHRIFLVRITILGGLATVLVALLLPNRYTSSTRLMSPDMHGSASEAMMSGVLTRSGGGLAGLSANLLGVDNSTAVFIGVLKSRSVTSRLVNRFDLKKVYRDGRDEDAAQDLADCTKISDDRKSGIITIAVEDRTPRRAAAMAAAYVEELNRLLVEVNTSSAHRERVFIEERLKVVKPALDDASKQLSDFSTRNTTLDPKEQGKAMVGAVVNLQGELIATETQLRGLEPIYSDSNVRIQSLKARIVELRHQLQELRGTGPRAGLPAGPVDEASYPSFRQLPALGLTYADLYREVKLREVVFETLTQQYEMAKIAEAKEIPSVKVLDPANLPEKKSGPPRLMIALLGTLFAFTFTAAWIVGNAKWKGIDGDDPRKQFAAEVLGDTIPAYSKVQQRVQRIGIRLRYKAESNGNDGHK